MFIENNNKKTFVPKVTKLKNKTKVSACVFVVFDP